MQKKYLLGLLVIIPMVLMIQQADALQKFSPASDVYRVFDDGLLYVGCLDNDDVFGYDECMIVHDGIQYDCKINDGSGNYLNPVCVEIILRSIP